MIKIGMCTGFDNLEYVKALGYDYMETAINGVVPMSDEEFSEKIELVEKNNYPVLAFNGMLPWQGMKITGEEAVGKEELLPYFKKASERANALGARAVVFGSGGARGIPEGFDYNKARAQFIESAIMSADAFGKYGIFVAIEPLNTKECNFLNYVKEAYELMLEVKHDYLKVLADFYHMRKDNEGMGVLLEVGSNLKHTHIARGTDRAFPLAESEDIYKEFFDNLKKIGYEGGVSVEASGGEEALKENGEKTLSLLKSLAS